MRASLKCCLLSNKKGRSVGPRVLTVRVTWGASRTEVVRPSKGRPARDVALSNRPDRCFSEFWVTAGFGRSAAASADYLAVIEAAGAALTTDQSERMRWRRGARHSTGTIRISLMGQSANALTGFTPLIINPRNIHHEARRAVVLPRHSDLGELQPSLRSVCRSEPQLSV